MEKNRKLFHISKEDPDHFDIDKGSTSESLSKYLECFVGKPAIFTTEKHQKGVVKDIINRRVTRNNKNLIENNFDNMTNNYIEDPKLKMMPDSSYFPTQHDFEVAFSALISNPLLLSDIDKDFDHKNVFETGYDMSNLLQMLNKFLEPHKITINTISKINQPVVLELLDIMNDELNKFEAGKSAEEQPNLKGKRNKKIPQNTPKSQKLSKDVVDKMKNVHIEEENSIKEPEIPRKLTWLEVAENQERESMEAYRRSLGKEELIKFDKERSVNSNEPSTSGLKNSVQSKSKENKMEIQDENELHKTASEIKDKPIEISEMKSKDDFILIEKKEWDKMKQTIMNHEGALKYLEAKLNGIESAMSGLSKLVDNSPNTKYSVPTKPPIRPILTTKITEKSVKVDKQDNSSDSENESTETGQHYLTKEFDNLPVGKKLIILKEIFPNKTKMDLIALSKKNFNMINLLIISNKK